MDTLKQSRHLNMKEPRLPGNNARVICAFDPNRAAILPIAGDKTNQWTRWCQENVLNGAGVVPARGTMCIVRFVSILGEIRRGNRSRASYVALLAAATLIACGNHENKPSPAYQRGYDAGHGAEVLRLIKQEGELPRKACSEILEADKDAKDYNSSDEAVYKQGCLDAVREQGI